MPSLPSNDEPARMRFRTTKQTKSDVKYEARLHHIAPSRFINDAIEYYRDAIHQDFNTPSVLVQRLNELVQVIKYQGQADLQSRKEVARVLDRFMDMSSGQVNDYLHHDRKE